MPQEPARFSLEELSAEGGTLLPAKEVLSLLDLNVDIDLALDLVAPIDLAVAGNLNVAAPINGAVSANVLSAASSAAAQSEHGVLLDQLISGAAIAHAPQSTVVDQTNDTVDGGIPSPPSTAPPATVDPLPVPQADATTGSLLDGDLLNVNVNVNLDADLAAPVAGAVALNANVAAPINASVAANVGTIGSQAVAVTNQQAVITQHLNDVTAHATADQDADISQ